MDIHNPLLRRRCSLRADGWRTTRLLDLMTEENIPGASVAVIEGGEIAWAAAYGVRMNGQPDPVTTTTRFQAASISKPIAALAALSLVQEGRLALDEDIRARQTSWKLPANHGWQPRVTLRHLLSHSGGITVQGFPGYAAGQSIPARLQILNGEPPANNPPILTDTIPGLQYRYSGGGFTILEQLLEDASGLPYAELVVERVLRPAGMDKSGFAVTDPSDNACGHRPDGQPLTGGWHTYPELAAAGLWTTPLDLARLVIILERTLTGKEETILSRALVEEMLKPGVYVKEGSLTGWYGLGLFLTREGEELYFGHGGSNDGFRASLIGRKGHGQATIVMTNADSGWVLTEAWDENVALSYGWPGFPWSPPEPIAMEPASLERFCGEYILENGWDASIRRIGDQLALETGRQPALLLLPREPLCFFTSGVNAEIIFVIVDETCTGLVLKQNGEEIKAKKRIP